MSISPTGSAADAGIASLGLDMQSLLKIILTQLTYQDPLKPVDNTEFLAQLAQFTNIEQTQVMSDNVNGLLSLESSSQAVSLLGRTVGINNNSQLITGSVTGINFNNGVPSLSITQAGSSSPINGIGLAQIISVAPTTESGS